jgi:hypothetical protein
VACVAFGQQSLQKGGLIYRFSIFIILFAFPTLANLCHYETWEWDTLKRKSVGHRQVIKQKAEMTKEEKGNVPGCSVCEEDQMEIRIKSLPVVKVCRVFHGRIRQAMEEAMSQGFPISSLIGYRVGKSKGPIDSKGLRTEFSHHSFGTAIDFNAEKNGLYDSCPRFGPECQLIRGGKYRPSEAGSITPDTSLYQALRKAGFRWGGEIQGKQKDFMHFSLDGT